MRYFDKYISTIPNTVIYQLLLKLDEVREELIRDSPHYTDPST